MSRDEIKAIIERDTWMMEIIRVAMSMNLPDCWVSAGFVRNKVWDHLHGYESRTPLEDIDVIYFDRESIDEECEKIIEKRLTDIIPNVKWSVKNQARMHKKNNNKPYASSTEALSKYTEIPTSIAVALENGELIINAPHGTDDLMNLVVKPTPHYEKDKRWIYENRIKEKQWHKKWPKLLISK